MLEWTDKIPMTVNLTDSGGGGGRLTNICPSKSIYEWIQTKQATYDITIKLLIEYNS